MTGWTSINRLRGTGSWLVDPKGQKVAIVPGTDEYGGVSGIGLAGTINNLTASLTEMIEIFGGKGDGHLPEAACIIRARAALERAGA